MRTATLIDPLLGPSRIAPPLRLAFGRVLFRVTLLSFVISELAVWRAVHRAIRGQPRINRVFALLFFTPQALVVSFLVGAVVAVSADLFIRLVLRPILARWYDPRRPDASLSDPAAFHLSSRERVENELPARRIDDRSRASGKLVLTNQRLCFFPDRWQAEPWSARLDDLTEFRLARPAIAAWGAVRGWPDEVVVIDTHDHSVRFALADPDAFLDWFEQADLPRYLHHDPA